MSQRLEDILSNQAMAEVETWVAKYPESQRQSAVMQTLTIVQQEYGYLTEEKMDSVAAYLGMPNVAVYEVATFYSMYEHEPVGRHRVEVCTNISCKLRGSDDVVSHLKKVLGVEVGETTADNIFTLRTVECLGACVNAPMMQIGKTYHENLNAEKIDTIINDYREKE